MEIILRKNATDPDMIDIVGMKDAERGVELLWGVVHADFLHGEGGALEEIFNANGEVNVEIDVKL